MTASVTSYGTCSWCIGPKPKATPLLGQLNQVKDTNSAIKRLGDVIGNFFRHKFSHRFSHLLGLQLRDLLGLLLSNNLSNLTCFLPRQQLKLPFNRSLLPQ